MKGQLSLLIGLLAIAVNISGCSGSDKQHMDARDSSYKSGGYETVMTTYTETEAEGLEIYNELFKFENKVSINIIMTQAEINKLQTDYQKYYQTDGNKKSDVYRKADVIFNIGEKGYTVREVGVRLKGNTSFAPFYDDYGNPNICNFKLSFDETFDDKDDYGADVKEWGSAAERKARKKRTFATLNELDIKWNADYDETNIREIYATKLFEAVDSPVQKIGLSQLMINGNNYGLVKIYEPVDKKFLEKRLPESALGGDLYKCMWSECDNNGSRTGNWRGATYKTDNSYGIQKNPEGIRYNLNLKTNKKTSNHESLINFLNVVNKQDITKDELERVLDVDSYANFMAAEYFAGNPDDIRNNFNNHYIYFRKDNGKAIFIVYDNDHTLGLTYGMDINCAVIDPYSDTAAIAGSQENPLIKNTLTHEPLPSLSYVRDKYTAALKKLSETEMLASDDDFNKMYNIAKFNYKDIIDPYIIFANQEWRFEFSLAGQNNSRTTMNAPFEQFRSQIMDTYKSSKP